MVQSSKQESEQMSVYSPNFVPNMDGYMASDKSIGISSRKLDEDSIVPNPKITEQSDT